MDSYLIRIAGQSNAHNSNTGVAVVEAETKEAALEQARELREAGCYSTYQGQYTEAVLASEASEEEAEDAFFNCEIVDSACQVCGAAIGKQPRWQAENAYCGCKNK